MRSRAPAARRARERGRHGRDARACADVRFDACTTLRLKQPRIQTIVRRLPQIDQWRGLRRVIDRQITTSPNDPIEVLSKLREDPLSFIRADDAEADGGG